MADAHADHNSPEYLRSQLRTYFVVGFVLLLATVTTVLVSMLDLPRPAAIYIGVAIAVAKASLVAAFFMHLIDERKIIYVALSITVFMFFCVLAGPIFTEGGSVKTSSHIAEQVKAAHHEAGGGGHH